MKSCTSKGFVTAVQSAMASECSVCYFLIAPLSSRVSCQPVLCGPLLLCRHIQSAGSNWGLSFAETVIRRAFQRPVSFSIEIMGTLSLQSVSSNCRVWESGAHKWSFTRGPAVLFFLEMKQWNEHFAASVFIISGSNMISNSDVCQTSLHYTLAGHNTQTIG